MLGRGDGWTAVGATEMRVALPTIGSGTREARDIASAAKVARGLSPTVLDLVLLTGAAKMTSSGMRGS
jgi:hypothetical protein